MIDIKFKFGESPFPAFKHDLVFSILNSNICEITFKYYYYSWVEALIDDQKTLIDYQPDLPISHVENIEHPAYIKNITKQLHKSSIKSFYTKLKIENEFREYIPEFDKFDLINWLNNNQLINEWLQE